jgi:pSer/pThr/pTyr-binding forkhead associated (FHA) protein
MNHDPQALAKITWFHPETGEKQEYILMEGATASIGRSSSNDICIPEQHVSRQHAVITYRDGLFMLTDLNSANGTQVNDEPLTEAFPLTSGDEIRLYVPTLYFSAAVTLEEALEAQQTGTLIAPRVETGAARLIITTGVQEGTVIALTLDEVTIGRATANARWEVGLQDAHVSRPHARLKRIDTHWMIHDVGSSNGTQVNDKTVSERGYMLADGDVIGLGMTLILFRVG